MLEFFGPTSAPMIAGTAFGGRGGAERGGPGSIPAILAAEAVAGNDEFCMNYVTAQREGRLG